MDKPSNERGSTGPTDGIKAEGDAGNERHICKANPAMIDDIGKKHGLEDTSENFSGKKYALAPKAATKFLKASRCYVALVLIMGVVCWIAALVIFGVRSYMRSVYPELRDHSSSASHVLVGIISFLVLVMVFPVLVITLLSALMTL